jgi:hypothetical protein
VTISIPLVMTLGIAIFVAYRYMGLKVWLPDTFPDSDPQEAITRNRIARYLAEGFRAIPRRYLAPGNQQVADLGSCGRGGEKEPEDEAQDGLAVQWLGGSRP